MITKKDVADLQPGDVVEIRFDSGSILRGPLTADGYGGEPLLGIADVHWPLRLSNGDVQHYLRKCTLTVVSRAPRPLYVNHPRTEPVAGDVARDDAGRVWVYGGAQYPTEEAGPLTTVRVRLLVDGETGQVVP